VLLELVYALDSFWHTGYYFHYGLAFLAALLLALTSGEIAVLVTFHRLNSMDPKWWWIAFKIPALSSLYVFLLGVGYYLRYAHIELVSAVMCALWLILACLCYMLFCGAAGFITSFFFVRKIYSLIRLD
jgi:transmembrane 9 superfamily protein 2/4